MQRYSTIECMYWVISPQKLYWNWTSWSHTSVLSVREGSFSESGMEVLLQKGDDMETINSIDRNLPLRLKYTVSVPPMSELEVLAVADVQQPGGTWLVEVENSN